MSQPIAVACPHCHAQFAVSDPSLIGRQVRCPSCTQAFVVAQPDSGLTEDEVKAHVAEHLASYKHIRIVEFTDEIPKSASGKILRRFLRDGG